MEVQIAEGRADSDSDAPGNDAPGHNALGGEALAAALEGLGEGIFLCDAQGRIGYLNPALKTRLGFAGTGGGRHWSALFVEEAQRRIEQEALPAVLSEGRWRGRVVALDAAGRLQPSMLSLAVAGEGGGMVGLLMPLEDDAPTVADAISRDAARRERFDALRRLAGDLSHDLNNVLTSILGYARFLTEDLPADSEPHGFAGQIVVATERAKALIDETLVFARRGKGERRALAVAPVLRRAVERLRGDLPDGATLAMEGDGDDLAVDAEPAAFAVVVQHLLANAAESLEGRPGCVRVSWCPATGGPQSPNQTPADVALEASEAGSLRLTAGVLEQGRGYLELTIEDDGDGIAAAAMEHLFEPYFTTRQPSKGRGLGLSTVFGQVVGHGGMIQIDSAPGRGTTVRLLWPIAARAEAQPVAARTQRRRLPRGHGQRILVAEDDRVLREAIGEMLQRLGYRPILVDDGEGARRLLAEGSEVEAVLTDRRMPHLSGTDLIEWMRSVGLSQPVLLYTGYGEDLKSAELAGSAGVAMLSKPIDAATLAGSLEQLLTSPSAGHQGQTTGG